MSHLLHPPLLDEAGLASALAWYVDGFAERSKIKVEFDYDQPLAGCLSKWRPRSSGSFRNPHQRASSFRQFFCRYSHRRNG